MYLKENGLIELTPLSKSLDEFSLLSVTVQVTSYHSLKEEDYSFRFNEVCTEIWIQDVLNIVIYSELLIMISLLHESYQLFRVNQGCTSDSGGKKG